MGNQTRVNDLPDLGARNEIVADNIRATQVLYTAAMLEELKVFQVVDRLTQLFQHGLLTVIRRSTGTHRYRTMATAGATIISWLAAHIAKLHNKNTRYPLVKIGKSVATRSRQGEPLKVATRPTDADLVNACEQWLSVSGLSDEQIDSFAEPRSEARTSTAR